MVTRIDAGSVPQAAGIDVDDGSSSGRSNETRTKLSAVSYAFIGVAAGTVMFTVVAAAVFR